MFKVTLIEQLLDSTREVQFFCESKEDLVSMVKILKGHYYTASSAGRSKHPAYLTITGGLETYKVNSRGLIIKSKEPEELHVETLERVR